VEVPLGEAVIEWTDVADDSPVADRSLRDANLRQRTGVSVLAVQRGDETVANPEPAFELAPGDILVTLGTREEHAELDDLLSS
jgi:TrkA domain protein